MVEAGKYLRAAVMGLFQGVFWNYISGETAKLGKFLHYTRSHSNLMSLKSAVQFAYWEPPGRQAKALLGLVGEEAVRMLSLREHMQYNNIARQFLPSLGEKWPLDVAHPK